MYNLSGLSFVEGHSVFTSDEGHYSFNELLKKMALVTISLLKFDSISSLNLFCGNIKTFIKFLFYVPVIYFDDFIHLKHISIC